MLSQELKHGCRLKGGAYIIESVLGQGGFGITYLARVSASATFVAIKEYFPKTLCNRDSDSSAVTPATASQADTVERYRRKFLKEARHISELSSPYIVSVTDVFEENNTAYYVMDYIDGSSLSQLVKEQGPLPVERAVGYICRVGRALEYVHTRRMNHLDVKPGNVMVRRADDTPILIDFGLSKQYDSSGNQTSTTPTGISHGYAPLEQYDEGGVREFSPQTDIYSLAATLYYLVSGEVPPRATAVFDSGLTFPPGFPEGLKAVISRAMSPSRRGRHETVDRFIADLTSSAGDESTCISTPVADESTQIACQHSTTSQPPAYTATVAVVRPKKSRTGVYLALGGALVVIVACVCLWIIYSSAPSSPMTSPTPITAGYAEDSVAPPVEEPVEKDWVDMTAEDIFNENANYDFGAGNVYYTGNFYNDPSKKYPMKLKIERTDGRITGAVYANDNYNTRVDMSVSFTYDEMVVTGMLAGKRFEMRFTPGDNGGWEGTAQTEGSSPMRAELFPELTK